MKLYYSNTSPYSRKVRMMIHIMHLETQIENILINPFTETEKIRKINPLGKVPVLELDNGEILYDSQVICQYIENMTSDLPQKKHNDWKHWENLRWEALADGLTDATYNLVMERRRPDNEKSNSSIKQWTEEITNTLDEFERKINDISCVFLLAHLSIASALGYLEFRTPDLSIKAKHPKTFLWYLDFKKHDFMKMTHPEG
ncbi:MAG: glutathione S-transferase N-terminal domain-containing protein [gamma proteobacterium symbiont of Taylorina sp.]|nr:glutathione S-transferase N-terminal domain-containing protein [gamma proteobacterium symbiont of Taylorina sp.]